MKVRKVKLALWSRIFYSPSLVKFRDPASRVSLAGSTSLRLAQQIEKQKQFCFSIASPTAEPCGLFSGRTCGALWREDRASKSLLS